MATGPCPDSDSEENSCEKGSLTEVRPAVFVRFLSGLTLGPLSFAPVFLSRDPGTSLPASSRFDSLSVYATTHAQEPISRWLGSTPKRS